MSTVRPTLCLCAVLASLFVLGCSHPRTTVHRTGVMEYLYPKREAAPAPTPGGARLHLPLKLGIAFVPSQGYAWRSAVPATSERPLLDIVREAFQARSWVQEIKVIPSAYLRAGGGFDNLEQAARMYGVDVMALVSVDQIQYTDPKWYSFAYLTIVGLYTLPAEKNDTRTLIDVAVFDVATRTFLLRAPGQSTVKGSATPIRAQEQLRLDSGKGLELALKDLNGNLAREVEAFKADVASGARKDVDVVDREGRSLRQAGGRSFGGSMGLGEAVAGLALAALAWRRRRP